MVSRKRPRVLTWHIHGSYLYYLSHADIDLFVPARRGRPERWGGTGGTFPWGPNVHEVKADDVKNLALDCILFQAKENYETDQFEILSREQRALPRIYLEHDPPRQTPTDTRHHVDANVLVVHVTHFNALMWDSPAPTTVIEHGVALPAGIRYSGEKERGLVVVNNIALRGRRLGLDIFERVRSELPIDLIGIDAAARGGLGEMPRDTLLPTIASYRFFFNPIRYTSLPLALCEAMMIGTPVVALATTEVADVIHDGENGFTSTNIDRLISDMRRLLADKKAAARLGAHGKKYAEQRFSIERFTKDWEATITNWIAIKGERSPRHSTREGFLVKRPASKAL